MNNLYGIILKGEHQNKHGYITNINTETSEFTIKYKNQEIVADISNVRTIQRPKDIGMDFYIDWE